MVPTVPLALAATLLVMSVHVLGLGNAISRLPGTDDASGLINALERQRTVWVYMVLWLIGAGALMATEFLGIENWNP